MNRPAVDRPAVPPTRRCLVADDHPALLAGIRDLLVRHGMEVVGTATSTADAIAKIGVRRPDVAVVDLHMPADSGLAVARQAASVAPSTKVLLYTGYATEALLSEALDAGARGLVLKEAPSEDLLRAIETVHAGGFYLDPAVHVTLQGAGSGRSVLTQREREILRLLSQGLSNDSIGRQLFISPETVRTHVRKAMGKLGAGTRVQAVATALRRSLIA